MRYDDWEKTVDDAIKQDSLWKMTVYRLALLMGDLVWHDTTHLLQDKRMGGLSDQLYRAVGSISANLAEGYSRGTGKDRARFYEYALGSARESRDWYFKARRILGDEIHQHRLALLTRIIQLILTMIPQQRGQTLRETPALYETNLETVPDSPALLDNIPLPADA